MEARSKITKALVEHAKAPQSEQVFIRDDEVTGFALRITAKGAKSFVWEGRVKGRTRRVTLGQYPTVSAMKARELALAMKVAVSEGGDPSVDRKKLHRELTFAELADRFIEDHAKAHKKSWEQDVRRIKVHLSPRFGTRRLSDIRPDEIVSMQQQIKRDRGLYESNRVTVLIRTIFNIGRDMRLYTGENPALRIKLFREEKRERFLSPEELHRVNAALEQETNEYWRAYFPLSLMLGTRKNELLAARWKDIDLAQRTLLLPVTKSGRPHLLPLPTPAVELLRGLASYGRNEWVFPGTGVTGHLVEVKSAWGRIRRLAGVPDARVHDLRRTLGSWLAAAGHSLPLIGRALNHSNSSSTSIYARLGLDPVRAALESNAALMMTPLPLQPREK
jgi:integrase